MLRWLGLEEVWLARREQSSSPSRFETLPTNSNGNLADRWLSAHPAWGELPAGVSSPSCLWPQARSAPKRADCSLAL